MLYIARYAEIALKGKNRSEFENKLKRNINRYLKNKGVTGKAYRTQGMLIIKTDKSVSLKTIFGLQSYSPSKEIQPTIKEIKKQALNIARKSPKTATFRISAKRNTKDYELNSMQINQIIPFIADNELYAVAVS